MLPLTLLAALAAPEPAPVPADALVVVHARGLGHLHAQAAGLLRAVAPDRAGEAVRRLDELFAPAVAGFDPSRRLWLAVVPDAGAVSWVAFLPTRDPARLTLPDPLRRLDRPAAGWVVVTPSDAVARRLAANPPPMPVNAFGEASGLFFGADVGVFVNLPAVAAGYGPFLTGTKYTLPHLLAAGAFGLPKLDRRQADQIAAVANGLIQIVVDGTGLVLAVHIGPAGVTAEVALAVRPHTPTARLLAAAHGPAGPLLDALPGGQSAYSAVSLAAEAAGALAVAFPEFQPPDPKPAVGESLARATAGTVAGPTLELVRLAAVPLDVLASVRGRAAYRNVPLLGPPAVLAGAERVGRLLFDRVTLRYDLVAATRAVADPGVRQAAHATVRQLVGDGHRFWQAADAGRVVRVTADDWAAAEPLAAAYLRDGPTAAADPLLGAVRAELPADASAVALLDAAAVTVRAGTLLGGVIEALPAFPGLELPPLVPAAGRSPFLGLALSLKPGSAVGRLVLPAAALRAAVATVRIEP